MKHTQPMTTSQLIQALQQCAPGATVHMCVGGITHPVGHVGSKTDCNDDMIVVLDEPVG